jgi:hypothetical protein
VCFADTPFALAQIRFVFAFKTGRGAESRRTNGPCAFAQASFIGSGEPELLFLVRPDGRQVADEPGDGLIGGGSTLGDRLDDARGKIGERDQEPNVSLGQVPPFAIVPMSAAESLRIVSTHALQRAIAVSSADRVASSIAWRPNGECEIPLRRGRVAVKGTEIVGPLL